MASKSMDSSWLCCFSGLECCWTRPRTKRLDEPLSNSKPEPSFRQRFHKVCWQSLELIHSRSLIGGIQWYSGSRCFFDPEQYPGVKGYFALTIDDAPCSQKASSQCMLGEVRSLLAEHDAKATFFLCTDCVGPHRGALLELLEDGHEVANHCPKDQVYDKLPAEEFQGELLRAEEVCEGLRRDARRQPDSAVARRRQKVFRAPWGRQSPAMKRILKELNYENVFTDCYANDPWIPDSEFIADVLAQSAMDGSIMVIHTPERGFREYNFEALKLTLEKLSQRPDGTRLRAVTYGELRERALESHTLERSTSADGTGHGSTQRRSHLQSQTSF